MRTAVRKLWRALDEVLERNSQLEMDELSPAARAIAAVVAPVARGELQPTRAPIHSVGARSHLMRPGTSRTLCGQTVDRWWRRDAGPAQLELCSLCAREAGS